MDHINVVIGKELRAILAAEKITVTALAGWTGISTATLHRYLNGTRDITVNALSEILSNIGGITEADFFERIHKTVNDDLNASPMFADLTDPHQYHRKTADMPNMQPGIKYLYDTHTRKLTELGPDVAWSADAAGRYALMVLCAECGGVELISTVNLYPEE